MTVHTLHFAALDRRIECREDETVFAAARRAGLRIVGACGGRGVCGSCKIRFADGSGHDSGARHEAGSESAGWERACVTHASADLSVEIAPRSLAPVVRADVGGTGDEQALELDASVQQIAVSVAPASLHDGSSDAVRLRRALAAHDAQLGDAVIEATAVAELPPVLRGHRWHAAARIVQGPGGPRMIGVARPNAPLLGLAVDLGTTNAAGFLIDLASGRRLTSLGLENPQVAWGADLIARLNHAVRSADAAESLQRAAVTVIGALAHDLARAVHADAGDIVEIAVCGNTAMQHLLAGWPVAQLGRAPFVAASTEATELLARDLGLAVCGGARLQLAPGVGGFVGGDHVAALLATEPLWTQAGTSLVMDIGTNTEVSLVHCGRIWSASCPSGPALEGGHIACGMRTARGAVEAVGLGNDGLPTLKVIGGGAPVGLCGSGVLDALAVARRAGWIDERGRIAAHGAVAATIDGARAVVLAPARRASPAVWLTQDDVRAVQLAKSAIRTGTRLLCGEAGIDESQIDRFVIAGAFGANIDLGSATSIGLLPPLPRARFAQVGNAAGLGVQQMLASRRRRQRAAGIAAGCLHIELSARADFQKTFLRQIGL